MDGFMAHLSKKQLIVLLASMSLGGCASTPPDSASSAPPDGGGMTAERAVQAEPMDEMAGDMASPADTSEPMAEEAGSAMESEAAPDVAMKEEPAEEPAPAVEEMPAAEVAPPLPVKKPVAPPVEKAAQPEPKMEMPTDPNTFLVRAAPKDKEHPFFGVGNKMGFVVNGEPGKPLVLRRGEMYKFEVDTGVQHDFYLTSSPKGWGAGTYTDGVDGQFTYKGTVTFKPGTTAPDVLYYGCRNHKHMGGKIYIANKGETVMVEKFETTATASKRTFKATPQQVKQKISYGQMLIANSPSAKRIVASGNQEARDIHAEALAYLDKASQHLDSGGNEQAMADVDEALRLMNAAARLVPSEEAAGDADYLARYEHLHKEVLGYEKSYQKNLKRLKGDVEHTLDESKFKALVSDAESLAARDEHKEAGDKLQQASSMITGVLGNMLQSQTIEYDKDFATPREEYEYELARNESYVELIPIAIEQRHPNEGQVKLMNNFVAKSESIVGEGKALAAKGDYTMAIQAMQAATDNLRRALMIVGVR
jgi:hypothetical protein